MKNFYGAFFVRGADIRIDPNLVPRALHPLIPYARFWGEPDDAVRAALVNEAPKHIRKNLAIVVRHYLETLEEWVSDDGIRESQLPEFVAFVNLLMVFHDPRVGGTY